MTTTWLPSGNLCTSSCWCCSCGLFPFLFDRLGGHCWYFGFQDWQFIILFEVVNFVWWKIYKQKQFNLEKTINLAVKQGCRQSSLFFLLSSYPFLQVFQPNLASCWSVWLDEQEILKETKTLSCYNLLSAFILLSWSKLSLQLWLFALKGLFHVQSFQIYFTTINIKCCNNFLKYYIMGMSLL